MHHTDLPVVRLPSAVSPLRKLPLDEKNQFAYSDAPFPGQPFTSSQLGIGLSHLQISSFSWLRPLLNLHHSPTSPSAQICSLRLLQVEIPTALSNKPSACSPPSHSLHFRESNLPSVPLDLFPSPLTIQCLHDVSLHFLLNLLLKLLFLKISACRKGSDKLIPSKVTEPTNCKT